MVSRVISLGFVYLSSFVLGVTVLIHGWGLKPVSWWWILGGFIGSIVLLLLVELLEEGD